MKDEKFDELFDEAFERAVSSASPVDPDSRRAAWGRLNTHRQQQSSETRDDAAEDTFMQHAGIMSPADSDFCRILGEPAERQRQSFGTRYKRTIRMTSVAAGLILLGSIAFSEPLRTGALNPLYQKLYTWSTGEALIKVGDNKPLSTEGALTDPPPDSIEKPINTITENASPQKVKPGTIVNEIHYQNETVSLDEIKDRLAFPMPEFPRVPSDLKLDQALLVVPDNGQAPDHFLLYYSGEGERSLMIEVRQMPEDMNGTIGFGSGTVSEVELANGMTGQFIDRGGSNVVHLLRGRIDISIIGVLKKQELLDIAGHLVDGKS